MELTVVCRNGLAALERALAGRVDPEKDPIAEATRCTAAVREALIERARRGDTQALELLTQANALLSEMVAAEFPLVGFRRDRIEKACEHYRRLVAALGS